jgi:hypothetical protein
MRRELTALSPRKLCAAGVAGALRQNRVSKKKVSLSLSLIINPVLVSSRGLQSFCIFVLKSF